MDESFSGRPTNPAIVVLVDGVGILPCQRERRSNGVRRSALWDFLWSAAMLRRFGFLFWVFPSAQLSVGPRGRNEKPKEKPKAARHRRTPKKIPKLRHKGHAKCHAEMQNSGGPGRDPLPRRPAPR